MKKYNMLFVFLLMWVVCKSQSNLNFHLNQYERKISTYDDVRPVTFDIENASVYTFRRNPAFLYWYANHADTSVRKSGAKNILVSSVSSARTKGDYTFYEGNKRFNAQILAGGEIVFEGVGTLFGSASYTSEQKKNIYQNYATNPMDYYPYMVSDTMGAGNIRFEEYEIDGGFSFLYRGFYYGIGAFYKGTSSYKLTDPRLSTYTSWFRLNLGIVKTFNEGLLSVKLYPELNRQHISATNYRQQSSKFFQFYGFGAWNKNESKGGYSYGRQMTIDGIGIDLAYKKLPQGIPGLHYSLNLVYNYRKMNTEEETFKNLFTSYTHHFKPELMLSKQKTNFHFYLLFTGDNNWRNGSEHVYENQIVSEEQKLHKYIKVGTNEMYSLRSFVNSLSLKTIYNYSPRYAYHLLAGVSHNYYEEKYIMPAKRIQNQSLTPFVGMGFNGNSTKHNLETTVLISGKQAISNVFDLPNTADRISLLQTYIPYLIRGESDFSVLLDITYAYSLHTKNAIGGKLAGGYQKRTQAPFMSHSLTDFHEKNRNVLFLNLCLFYLF